MSSTGTGFPSRGLGIVVFAANAFRRQEFAVRAPGKKPSLHIFVLDVMPGLYLSIGLEDFGAFGVRHGGHLSTILREIGFVQESKNTPPLGVRRAKARRLHRE